MRSPRTYTARWLFPVSSPPLAGGTITVAAGRIVAVEPPGRTTPDEDLGHVAVIPGLVNAHTHLDLSGARGRIPPTDPDHFTDWLRGVIAYRRGRSAEQTQADIRAGLAEALRFGTTLVGDITSGGASWAAVSTAAVRAVLFWELIGLSAERYQAALDELSVKGGLSWDEAAPPATMPGHRDCRWATGPHSPYSANHDQARGQLFLGHSAIHFAESPAEMELIASHTGRFVPFLKDLGAWDESAFTAQVADFFVTHPNARGPRLYIHGNYLPVETADRFDARSTLVYCPRTHAAFGHPPHPFREFLARGVRVALGTDSLASNPDLDLFAEARLVRRLHPDLPGDTLLRMATLSGAEALGFAEECGSFDVGKSADLVTVPLPERDVSYPYRALFDADASADRRTMFRGEWRVS